MTDRLDARLERSLRIRMHPDRGPLPRSDHRRILREHVRFDSELDALDVEQCAPPILPRGPCTCTPRSTRTRETTPAKGARTTVSRRAACALSASASAARSRDTAATAAACRSRRTPCATSASATAAR